MAQIERILMTFSFSVLHQCPIFHWDVLIYQTLMWPQLPQIILYVNSSYFGKNIFDMLLFFSQALISQLRPPQGVLSHQTSIPAPYLIPQLDLSEVQAQAATAHLNHMQAAVAAAYNQQISDAQAAQQQHQQRLQKPGHRPLGRTQSAPLPLGGKSLIS